MEIIVNAACFLANSFSMSDDFDNYPPGLDERHKFFFKTCGPKVKENYKLSSSESETPKKCVSIFVCVSFNIANYDFYIMI
jgi:hypothetical protein